MSAAAHARADQLQRQVDSLSTLASTVERALKASPKSGARSTPRRMPTATAKRVHKKSQ